MNAEEATHDCPGGCGQQVRDALLACKPCYLRMPNELRSMYDYWRPFRHTSWSIRGEKRFENIKAACLTWLHNNQSARRS